MLTTTANEYETGQEGNPPPTQDGTLVAPSRPLHQLAVESGLGRELEPIVQQIIGGQSREIFYTYLR